jgi:hypothetical protein
MTAAQRHAAIPCDRRLLVRRHSRGMASGFAGSNAGGSVFSKADTAMVRRRYNHLASLFYAQVRAAAWHDAGETMERVAPFVDEVRSTRSVNTLLVGLDALDGSDAAPSVRDTSF